jgi:hypothetical protein
MKRIGVLFLTFLVLGSGLWASGSQKKGFILGGGLGAGYMSCLQSYGAELYDWQDLAAAANVKAGYALSDSLELYVFGSGWMIGGRIWDIIGVAGVGVTKYLNKRGSGFFFTGGLGVSFFDFERDVLKPRPGFLLGAGYGLSKHWSLQADILNARISSGNSSMIHEWENAWGFRLTLNLLAF